MLSQKDSEHKFSKRLTFFYCVNLSMLAVALFLHGFFPVKNVKGSFASVNDLPMQLGSHGLNPDECYKAKVDKLVIMVIDAIRYDFIYGSDGETNMPYTSLSISKNKACLFKMRANAPTVTMPRIKAITSGSVSNFIDVLMNFGSTKMLTDNIIDQAKEYKYKMVFYGDETWLKLFPLRFDRLEGTTSFFVSDYTQVDDNVTRNLDSEMKLDDWDIMILHYLGLDHIGHLDGPKSKLIKPKLNEMDGIVKRIHNHLIKQEKEQDKSTLLMVLGDHGMADLGGHGGTSIPEIIVPLISFGLGCGGIHEAEIAQVDLASTLSILLGIPIPADNVGHVIVPLLTSSSSFSTAGVLYAVYYNAYQVVTQFLQNGGTILHEGYKSYWEAEVMYMEWLSSVNKSTSYDSKLKAADVINRYKHSLNLMSSEILKSAVDFHMMEIIIGIVILVQLFLIALFGVTFEMPSRVRLHIVSAVVCCVTLLCWWMNLLDISCCLSSLSSIVVTLVVIFVVTLNSILIANSRLSHVITSIMEIKPSNLISYLLIIGTILQTLSLASTSFIETEEKVWFHLFMFVMISAMLNSFRYNIRSASAVWNDFNYFFDVHFITILKWCALLIIHRVLKNYQECQYDFDVHWLSKEQKIIYHSVITIGGLISVWWSLSEISKHITYKSNDWTAIFEKFLATSCLLIIYYYRAVTGQLILPFYVIYNSRGVIEVTLFFILLTLLFLLKAYRIKRYSTVFNDSSKWNMYPQYLVTSIVEVMLTCWILLCSLLTRPHNIWLCSILILSCNIFNNQLRNNDVVGVTVVHYWIGMLFYFYQGNSNFISSIDITAGYVGQSDYNAVIAGLFIAINAYSFPVISYLLLLIKVLKSDWKLRVTIVYKVRSLILLLHLLFYLFIITVHRYHLFIWSVFSPKLLYLSVNSIFVVFLYWCTEFVLLFNHF